MTKTSTTAPKTAGEARALADQLAADEQALRDRKAAAAQAAQLEQVKAMLPEFEQAKAAEQDALAAWETARLDESVSPSQLVDVWHAAHLAVVHRATLGVTLEERWQRLEPLWDYAHHDHPEQLNKRTPHLAMTHNQWDARTDPNVDIARALADRRALHGRSVRATVHERIDKAGDTAHTRTR